ncbi:hypothetical protein CDAR_81991 [Caerostris darwini]|uniref:Uncharacterized protein n=1 Tax=Caerostris darwini TaxID=1538125 RepID=A0AAV4V6L4_9ARAC|nr:hypothetical protein CDAR_81991 [Caerostris darwini]
MMKSFKNETTQATVKNFIMCFRTSSNSLFELCRIQKKQQSGRALQHDARTCEEGWRAARACRSTQQTNVLRNPPTKRTRDSKTLMNKDDTKESANDNEASSDNSPLVGSNRLLPQKERKEKAHQVGK